MKVAFTSRGWDDYVSWGNDRATRKRIHQLIADIQRNGHAGLGKPERLSRTRSDWWSRRIDDKNRLVYRLSDDGLEMAQCRGHYDDK